MGHIIMPLRVLIIFMAVMAYACTAYAATGPAPVAMLKGMDAAYARVKDYTAVFIKQELVKGELLPAETIRFKFKKPFMVYMGWMEGPHEGREALYVHGRNDNKVVGHEGGLIGFITLHMDPEGSIAMRGNRHPITDVGIGRLIDIVLENAGRAESEGVLDIVSAGQETVFGRDAAHLTVKLPKGRGYYAGRIELWVDRGNGLPVKIMIYGWDGALWESYGYKDLVINPGIPGEEFDEGFKGYDF